MEDKVTHRVKNASKEFHGYMIFCPACECGHLFDSRWKFNGDLDKPTFTPSMLIHEGFWKDTGERHTHRCHSFVTNGKIKFLNDCTHAMKNKEVYLKPF